MGGVFDMGAETLSSLTKQTSHEQQDLGQLVREFVTAVEPLEGVFQGSGRAKFDEFKLRADEVANELNRGLGQIVEGQSGMDLAFKTGDQELADNSSGAQSMAQFGAANFGKVGA